MNVIETLNFKFKNSEQFNLICDKIKDALPSKLNNGEYTRIYSIILYNKVDNVYKITITYCDSNMSYNTVSLENSLKLSKIFLKNETNEKVIYFAQPSVEICLTVYKQYIESLAHYMANKWERYGYSYEEAKDDVIYIIVELHRKKYFLNKFLIKKAYHNHVFSNLRPYRGGKYQIVSLESQLAASDNDEALSIEAKLSDSAQFEFDKMIHIIEIKSDFEQIEKCILTFMSPRVWDQIKNAYINKQVTPDKAKQMIKIRKKLIELGII